MCRLPLSGGSSQPGSNPRMSRFLRCGCTPLYPWSIPITNFKAQHFKLRVLTTRITACLDLNTPFESSQPVSGRFVKVEVQIPAVLLKQFAVDQRRGTMAEFPGGVRIASLDQNLRLQIAKPLSMLSKLKPTPAAVTLTRVHL